MEQPRDTSTLGFVALGSGETRLIVSDRSTATEAQSSGGTIYTTLDLPSLEELLDAHQVIYAVLERPPPDVPVVEGPPPDVPVVEGPPPDVPVADTPERQRAVASRDRLGLARVVAPPAISAAIAAVGAALLVLALVGQPVSPNPYIGLLLLLVGIGLLHTTLVALRNSGWLR